MTNMLQQKVVSSLKTEETDNQDHNNRMHVKESTQIWNSSKAEKLEQKRSRAPL